MARGWESKSVEAQQADAIEQTKQNRPRLSPEAAARTRERENLRLAREQVLKQIENSRHARHRESLQIALAELEEKLKKLDE